MIYWLEHLPSVGTTNFSLVTNCDSYHGLIKSNITIQPKPGDYLLYETEKQVWATRSQHAKGKTLFLLN